MLINSGTFDIRGVDGEVAIAPEEMVGGGASYSFIDAVSDELGSDSLDFLPQDRATKANPDPAAAPDARSQVRALVARERAGGPTVTAAEVTAVTGRSRRRAYELLRDARTEQGGVPDDRPLVG